MYYLAVQNTNNRDMNVVCIGFPIIHVNTGATIVLV